MAADFWAGYLSGAIGILIGNPLDLIKVRLQAGTLTTITPVIPRPHLSPPTLPTSPTTTLSLPSHTFTSPAPIPSTRRLFPSLPSLLTGSAAPILGYGALNALLFMTYNRSSSYLTYGSLSPPPSSPSPPALPPSSLTTTFLAGALGGLATWIVSTPTELVKCRAQVATQTQIQTTAMGGTATPANSYSIFNTIFRTHGLRGLYTGGLITALRDSIGYGFYFWFYEGSTRYLSQQLHFPGSSQQPSSATEETLKVLLCGGLAGVVTWASVFPLDVVKTRVQTQVNLFSSSTTPIVAAETGPLLETVGVEEVSASGRRGRPLGAWEVMKVAYRTEGAGVFFKGLGVCSIRAFIVNAVQWAVYEGVMRELDPSRKKH